MDKESISQYGWVVILVIILCILMGMATPFGNYIKDAAMNATKAMTLILCDEMGIDPPPEPVDYNTVFTVDDAGNLGYTPRYACTPLIGQLLIEDDTLSRKECGNVLLYNQIEYQSGDRLTSYSKGEYNRSDDPRGDDVLKDKMIEYTDLNSTKEELDNVLSSGATLEQYLMLSLYQMATDDYGSTQPANEMDREMLDAACSQAIARNFAEEITAYNAAENKDDFIATNITYYLPGDVSVTSYNELQTYCEEGGYTIDEALALEHPGMTFDLFKKALSDAGNCGANEYSVISGNWCPIGSDFMGTFDDIYVMCQAFDINDINVLYKECRKKAIDDDESMEDFRILLSYETYDDLISAVTSKLPAVCEIPTEINGKTVTTIPQTMFFSAIDVKSFSVPDTVTHIGMQAFANCTKLKSLNLPDSVTTIDMMTFIMCPNLETLRWPSNCTTIPMAAFIGCQNLITVTNTDNVLSVSDSAFSNMINSIDTRNPKYACGLKSISLPNVKTIGIGAFAMTKLTAIDLPNVEQISDWAFQDITTLTSFTASNKLTSIGRGMFMVDSNQFGPSLMLHAPTGSVLETYATTNNIPFTAI